MTSERRRALWSIGVTLIIGILIGVFSMGLLHRQRGTPSRKGGWRDGKERFVRRLSDVVDASPEQAGKIEPIVQETTARIDSLQLRTEKEVRALLDSMEADLKPLLTDEQFKKLQRSHHRGRGHH